MHKDNTVTGFMRLVWAGFAPALLAAFLAGGGGFSGALRFAAALFASSCAYAALACCKWSGSARLRWISAGAFIWMLAVIALRYGVSGTLRLPVCGWVIETRADPAVAPYALAFAVMSLAYLVMAFLRREARETKAEVLPADARTCKPAHPERRAAGRTGLAVARGGSDVTLEELERLLKE